MNRGFLYGDGFFETIRVIKGQIPLSDFHIARIHDALDIYQLDANFDISDDLFRGMIPEETTNGILRINFFRDGGGKYLGETNDVAFNQSFTEYNEDFYIPSSLDLEADLKKAPVKLGKIATYSEPKPNVAWMTVKSLSSIYYVLAAKYKQKLNADYLLIKNCNDEICEELVSNVLIVKGEDIIVPSRKSGGVLGATLRYINATYGFQLTERVVTCEDIDTADAVYLCKGSTGIYRVK
jgi:branched-chain amino acid aminotransferase